MKVVVALGMLLLVAVGGIFESHAQEQTRAQFCAFQNSVCVQCIGVGPTVSKEKCLATCKRRLANCNRTGCFEWIAFPTICHQKASG